jgi:hypothetical protein
MTGATAERPSPGSSAVTYGDDIVEAADALVKALLSKPRS